MPPPLVLFQNYANWDEYEDDIYAIYLKTVSGLRFRGEDVKLRFLPSSKNKGYGFWHLISEAPEPGNHNEKDRIPDLRRCERIRWVAWCILNADSQGFSWWENMRKGEESIVIWAESYNFAVILAKRTLQNAKTFYLLKTAYCLRDHTIRKFRKERDAWRKAQNG